MTTKQRDGNGHTFMQRYRKPGKYLCDKKKPHSSELMSKSMKCFINDHMVMPSVPNPS